MHSKCFHKLNPEIQSMIISLKTGLHNQKDEGSMLYLALAKSSSFGITILAIFE